MPKKKLGKLEKQINVRVSQEMYDRVERCAMSLGLDSSGLARMMFAEKLAEYEQRARRADSHASTDGINS